LSSVVEKRRRYPPCRPFMTASDIPGTPQKSIANLDRGGKRSAAPLSALG